VVHFTAPTATDNCGVASLTTTHQPGSRFPVGVTTVTYTAEDSAGNRTTGSFRVTVEDKEAPRVTMVPKDDTVGICAATYTYATPTGTDNCGQVKVTRIAGLASGNVFPVGTTVNTFELEDEAGNKTTVSFRVTVRAQGEPQLPTVAELCEYEGAIDLTLGQTGIEWTGPGVTAPGTFRPAGAGVGRHVLSYSYKDEEGCQTGGTHVVTVLPAPTRPEVSKVGSRTLETGAHYVTYQWYRDGHLLPGATTNRYTYNEGGNYQVVVTNAQGCSAVSADHVVDHRGGGVGITETTQQSELKLYPNPSTGVVMVEVPEHWREALEIDGYSSTGQRILSKKIAYPQIEKVRIDLSDLPRGMYYLQFRSGNHQTNRKVTLR
jgi:hypothetical protein